MHAMTVCVCESALLKLASIDDSEHVHIPAVAAHVYARSRIQACSRAAQPVFTVYQPSAWRLQHSTPHRCNSLPVWSAPPSMRGLPAFRSTHRSFLTNFGLGPQGADHRPCPRLTDVPEAL